MKKTYQPFIIEIADQLIDFLEKQDFFKKEGISSTEYLKNEICENLTEKFLKGELSADEPVSFTEEEFEKLLKFAIANEALENLVEIGAINYFENENGEEMFFLTEDGRKIAEFLDKKEKLEHE